MQELRDIRELNFISEEPANFVSWSQVDCALSGDLIRSFASPEYLTLKISEEAATCNDYL